MNRNSLPIINNDNHNKSTHDLLHNIILNTSVLSDKYKSLTIINNTINYNNNINNYNNYLSKSNGKNSNLNLSLPSFTKNKKGKEYNDQVQIQDENDYFDINKSISISQKQEEIEKLKINLKNSKNYKEVINIQNEKSVSSRQKEENNIYLNNNISNSDNNIVNIEEISSNKINNENDKEENFKINKYNIKKYKEEENDSEYKLNENKKIEGGISENIYEINFDSPNKNANLVKKGKKTNNTYNSLIKSKNEEDIIKLYELNDTLSNDIIFIFANEETEYGLKLINLGMKYFVLSINNKQISIYIFDMNNKSENNKMSEGIEILLTELELHKIIKIVLCCGDESIFGFINKLNEIGINLEKIIFCALPFGRSNDLATHFGFGKSNSYTNINLKSLKKIIKDVIESTTMSIDIWEIKITFDKNSGAYITLNNNLKKFKTVTQTVRKGFISYFSLGYDSRIGFDISKKKSFSCKCCNLINFWWEGIKKSLFTKSLKLNQYLDALYHINLHKNDSIYDDSNNEDNQTIKEDNGRKITIFQTCGFNEHDNISENNSKSDNRTSTTNDVINKKTYNKANAIPADEIDGDEEFKKSGNINNIDIDNNIENESSESESEYEQVNNTLKTFKKEKIIIKGEPLGLVCQNIKYFCDGNISKWDTKEPVYGIQTYRSNKRLFDSTSKDMKEIKKVR